jgi:hypothetical protein
VSKILRLTEEEFQSFVRRGMAMQAAVDSVVSIPTRTRAARREHPEDDIQRAVVRYWSAHYPDTWDKTFHVPTGLAARNPKLAAIFVGLGMKRGVYDLICIAGLGPYHGFALELKSPHGSVSAEQSAWQVQFSEERWYSAVAFTLEAAIAFIDLYHSFDRTAAP